jgi:OOP family OmpA-OmpF porin
MEKQAVVCTMLQPILRFICAYRVEGRPSSRLASGVRAACIAWATLLAWTFTPATGLNAAPGLGLPPHALGSSTLGAVPVADKIDSRGFIWSATRIESGIRLRGSVPSDEVRSTVLGMVKAHFPDLEVEDRLKVAKGAPPQDQWLGAVSFGLQQLAHLKRGSVRLLDFALRIDGEAQSATDYTEVKKAITGPLPTGLISAKGAIKPPLADPFIFVADLDANALSLSGSVPSEIARNELRELSRQLFRRPGLDDRLELASGAPKDWSEAVIVALRALSQLDSGKVALSGLAVTIEGVAPDKGTAVAISYQLRRDLPAIFSTSESISWKEASTAAPFLAQMSPSLVGVAGKAPAPGGAD